MSILTGKEALIALANGEEVELQVGDANWHDSTQWTVGELIRFKGRFRLKPRTITINNIDVPVPFEPKEGDDFHVYYLQGLNECGYDWMHSGHYKKHHLVWKSKEEIIQVVAALRSIFK